jgi:hypothetical protein
VNPVSHNRIAAALVTVGLLALILVLAMWQRVDAACGGSGFDPQDPVATCQPPMPADVGRVSAEPTP